MTLNVAKMLSDTFSKDIKFSEYEARIGVISRADLYQHPICFGLLNYQKFVSDPHELIRLIQTSSFEQLKKIDLSQYCQKPDQNYHFDNNIPQRQFEHMLSSLKAACEQHNGVSSISRFEQQSLDIAPMAVSIRKRTDLQSGQITERIAKVTISKTDLSNGQLKSDLRFTQSAEIPVNFDFQGEKTFRTRYTFVFKLKNCQFTCDLTEIAQTDDAASEVVRQVEMEFLGTDFERFVKESLALSQLSADVIKPLYDKQSKNHEDLQLYE